MVGREINASVCEQFLLTLTKSVAEVDYQSWTVPSARRL